MNCKTELQKRDRDRRSNRRYVALGTYRLNGGVFGKINLILEYNCRRLTRYRGCGMAVIEISLVIDVGAIVIVGI